jgi:hypothetical protein
VSSLDPIGNDARRRPVVQQCGVRPKRYAPTRRPGPLPIHGQPWQPQAEPAQVDWRPVLAAIAIACAAAAIAWVVIG